MLGGTLAYVTFECRVEPGGLRQDRYELRVQQGDREPVTVAAYETEWDAARAGAVLGGTLGNLCRELGLGRIGTGLTTTGAPFHLVAVSPDGSRVAFELTEQFFVEIIEQFVPGPPPLDQLAPEEEGIFVVGADGSGLRRLGPASSVPAFNSVPLRTTIYPGFKFSPDGRRLVFVDRGPGRDGREALQLWTLDVDTGRRSQVTHLPPVGFPGPESNAPDTCCPRFVDDENIEFLSTFRLSLPNEPPAGPVCGNDTREGVEECDGADAAACGGAACLATCVCDNGPSAVPPLVVSLRADLADGAGPYESLGAGSPWVDLSGNAHDATLFNFAGGASSGWQGDGTIANPHRLEFDGAGDQRVTIPAGSIPEVNPAGSHSAAVWFKTSASVGIGSAPQEQIFEWNEFFSAPWPSTGLLYDGGNLVAWDCAELFPVAGLERNSWYHAVVTKEDLGDNGSAVRVYLNGVPVVDNPASTCLGDQASELLLGASSHQGTGNYSREMSGAIGQFELYGGVLTATQVAATFEAGREIFPTADVLPIRPANRGRATFAVKTDGSELRNIPASEFLPTSETPRTLETFVITGERPEAGVAHGTRRPFDDVTCPATLELVPGAANLPAREIFYLDGDNFLELTLFRSRTTGNDGGRTLGADGSTVFFTSATRQQLLNPPPGWSIVTEGRVEENGALRSTFFVGGGVLHQWGNVGDGDASRPATMAGTFAVADDTEDLGDYTLSLTVETGTDDAMGAMFRYRDPDNYYRFILFNGDEGTFRRLVKKVAGVTTVLAQDDFAYESDTAYALRVTVDGDRIRVFQDGTQVFDVTDSDLPRGGIALFTWQNRFVVFDDVSVTGPGGAELFRDDFENTGAVVNPGGVCQLFAIDVTGENLRQLTYFDDVEDSTSGCFPYAPRECGCAINGLYQDPFTEAVVFSSSCDPFGTNPNGRQLFAMRPDGTGLRQLTAAQGYVEYEDGSFLTNLIGPYAYSSVNPGGVP